MRAEIFGHDSGAIYVPEARVFGDVQKTLVCGTSPLVPQKGPETLPECPETLSRLQNPST